jgi:hypothetical protein
MHHIHRSGKLDGFIHTWHVTHETSKSEKTLIIGNIPL